MQSTIMYLAVLSGMCVSVFGSSQLDQSIEEAHTSESTCRGPAFASDHASLLQSAIQKIELMQPAQELGAMDKRWEELANEEKDAATALGFSEATWNVEQPPEWPRTKWQEISAEKRKALETLGYDQASWEADLQNEKLEKEEELGQNSLASVAEEEQQRIASREDFFPGSGGNGGWGDIPTPPPTPAPPPPPQRGLPAPHYSRCGFENSDGCGIWKQEDSDTFSWKVRSGRTPTSNTGPNSAHEGSKYFYIETTSIRSRFVETGQRRLNKGAPAVLRAFTTNLTAGAYIEFWYHMFGNGIGELKVMAKDSVDYVNIWAIRWPPYRQGVSELWKKSGDQGNSWGKAKIDLSKYAGSAITLWFMGIRGVDDKGDIAIDDVTIFSGGSQPNSPAPTPAPINYNVVALAESKSCGAKSKFVGRFMGSDGMTRCVKTVTEFGGSHFMFGKSCKTGACYVAWTASDTCADAQSRRRSRGPGLYYSRMYNFFKVVAGPPGNYTPSCASRSKKYDPANMPGQARSFEVSAKKCQERCASVSGCAHFSYWLNGGCHIQDAAAKEASTGSDTTAGPPNCNSPSPGSAPTPIPTPAPTPAPLSSCDEKQTGKGADYRGCQTKTRGGFTCQKWTSQSPHRHSRTPSNYPNAGLESNYCRNPDGEPSIWCYTTSPSKRWEYCDPKQAPTPTPAPNPQPPAPTPAPTPAPSPTPTSCDEKQTGKGADYRGCQTKTRGGFTCQKWTSQSPHRHSRTPSNYPNAGLESNYCRNPDGEPSIWCYTTSPSKRWEYCDPKQAPTPTPAPVSGPLICKDSLVYKTSSGKVCKDYKGKSCPQDSELLRHCALSCGVCQPDPTKCVDDPNFKDPYKGETCAQWQGFDCTDYAMSSQLIKACPSACGAC